MYLATRAYRSDVYEHHKANFAANTSVQIVVSWVIEKTVLSASLTVLRKGMLLSLLSFFVV
jgi:hypothetical protein